MGTWLLHKKLAVSDYRDRKKYKRKVRKKTYKNKPKTVMKMAIETYMLIITLNVNK